MIEKKNIAKKKLHVTLIHKVIMYLYMFFKNTDSTNLHTEAKKITFQCPL